MEQGLETPIQPCGKDNSSSPLLRSCGVSPNTKINMICPSCLITTFIIETSESLYLIGIWGSGPHDHDKRMQPIFALRKSKQVVTYDWQASTKGLLTRIGRRRLKVEKMNSRCFWTTGKFDIILENDQRHACQSNFRRTSDGSPSKKLSAQLYDNHP